jgi:hypothetical protein
MSLGFPQTSYHAGGGSGTAHFPTGQQYSQFGPQPALIPNFVTLGHVRENHVLRSSPGESPSKASEPLPAPHEMINMASLARGDVLPPEDELPPGWEVGQDQAGNKHFYNKDLNVTQWNRPAVAGLVSPVPVVEITQIQRYKTVEICSLRPDIASDLLLWLKLDVVSISTQSVVERILSIQVVHDNFLELVLESSTPFLVSVRFARAFQRYAWWKRSEDMRMADAAAETAAALQFLACAIVREEKFASLLMKSSSNESILSASSTFRDLKDDASIAKQLFYREVTEALDIATYCQFMVVVSEPLISGLIREQWVLTTGYTELAPVLRFWLHKASYIVLCVAAWFLKPDLTDYTDDSGLVISNLQLEAIVGVLALTHAWSSISQLASVTVRRIFILTTGTVGLRRRNVVEDSSEGVKARLNKMSVDTGVDDRELSNILSHLSFEMIFYFVALFAAFMRRDIIPGGASEAAADMYLFTIIWWWSRIVTIMYVHRKTGMLY